MKIKKDKKQEKLPNDEKLSEPKKQVKKYNPNLTLSNANVENVDEETSTQSASASGKPLKVVDVNIFKYFKELTSEDDKIRIEAAVQLLQQFTRTKDPEKREKEVTYTLKRLVRGCGASTNISRAGFFTGLIGFLKSFDEKHVTTEHTLKNLNKELNVGATIAKKEDADAVIGKILVCGALLRSGRLNQANSEHLEEVVNILLQSSRHRTYHESLGYSFLCEIIETLSQEQFETCIWPLLQKDLIRPWSKQSLQTVHCLISVQKKFPNIVNSNFLKTNFGGKELLNPESFQYLHKIFWQHSNTDILIHPAFECFGSYIATSKNLCQFWSNVVDPGLENSTKLLEVETLKILSDILDNLNVEQTNVNELLTDNFMRMFIDGLKNLKQKKDETSKAFYADFLQSLVNCCEKIIQDASKVAVIKRLILTPGTFNIEKFCGYRIVHQLINLLGKDGVKDIFQLYKSVFLAELAKNPKNSEETWLNFERLNAGYMLQHLLQHKSVQESYKWREKQFKFLFTCGLCYVTDSGEICMKEQAGALSKDFSEQCKNMFYSCLQSKLYNIQQEQKLLYNLAEYCNEKISAKYAAKYFRIKNVDDSIQKCWKNMFDNVSQSIGTIMEKKANKTKKFAETNKMGEDKLQTVFNILLLNMGLQLFRDAEMAVPAVEDLLKCMQRANKKKFKKTNDQASQHQEEPEWIEVLVDLFLHLLSLNDGALRKNVNALFPHICANLSLSVVHQILAMLDMKDGNNPLSNKNEHEGNGDVEESVDEEELETEVANGIDDKSDNEDDDNDDEDDNDDDESDEDDAEDDDDDESDEDDAEDDDDDAEDVVAANDKLRNVISKALIGNGSAGKVDDDMDSVDLNDMTEEEGRKLDDALSSAFKALKKSSSGSSHTKKSKNYRVKTTSVLHFRIRVLDLIDIYLQHKPTLLISIEIMLSLYKMLEYCVGDELKPLQTKVVKTLTKLTTQKHNTTEDDLNEDNFVDFIRLIVEKKVPAVSYEIVNKMRNKCICFLISNAQKINSDENNSGKILKLFQEYVHEFINSRNPIVNITLLTDIFKLRWGNIWFIAADLIRQGLSVETRTFRRIQVYEIVSGLYKNYELYKQDEDVAKKHFRTIEKILSSHIKTISENRSIQPSPKEYETLLDLILTAEKIHRRLELPTTLTNEKTFNALQNIRKHVRLESSQIYHRFCNIFNLEVIRNSEVENQKQQNDSDCESENIEDTKGSEVVGQKRKLSTQDVRKIKKQKKQQRLETASRGLNGGIDFTEGNNKSIYVENDHKYEYSD